MAYILTKDNEMVEGTLLSDAEVQARKTLLIQIPNISPTYIPDRHVKVIIEWLMKNFDVFEKSVTIANTSLQPDPSDCSTEPPKATHLDLDFDPSHVL
jgi:hypothetical protein